MEEKISIVTPIYNAEGYLRRCIESQIMQTYQNIEIILIDDGSTDNSGMICDNFAKNDNRIRVIHKKNQGVSIARNEGIKLATGDWILFVDSDDFLEKNACEKFIEISKKYNQELELIVASSNLIKGEQKTNSIAKFKKEALLNEIEKKKMINNIFINVDEDFSYVGAPWAKLYRLTFLKKYSLNFRPKLQLGEDLNFNFKAMYLANKIVFSPQIVYNYTISQFSISNKYMENMVEQFNMMFEEFEENKFINEFYNEYMFLVLRQLKKLELRYFFNNENIQSDKEIRKAYLELINTYPYNRAISCAKLSEYNKLKKKIYIIALKKKWYMLIKIWNSKGERK